MQTTYPATQDDKSRGKGSCVCTLEMFTGWMHEIRDQPPWRAQADKVADYIDGNQLDSETLADMRAIGMPTITENLMAPALNSVKGMEALNKLDWRVTPDGVDASMDEIGEAMSHKLTEAERMSNADDAISDAYGAQIGPGIGWVEVSRSYDPFAYPHRVVPVHRNEIWWDWHAKDKLMADARWLIRRRWTDRDLAKAMFPKHAELIEHAGTGWTHFDDAYTLDEGGSSTDLALNYEEERGWSIEEQEWRDIEQNRVCLYECWYRHMEPALLMQTPDGRVIEYDKNNPAHVQAVQMGLIKPQKVMVNRVRLAWWMGPHMLHDGPTPHPHNEIPYVPFFGFREDRTNIPFGLGRAMIPLQDEVNARLSRMQWGMAAVRVTRTAGAVAMDEEQFRDEIARPDADIVLDAEAMRAGGVFKVERDYQLNQQQYQRYVDARDGIQRVAGIHNAFLGKVDGGVTSGVGLQSLTQQSNQNLADINDNTRYARKKVGELLLSLVVQDIGNKPMQILIPGGAVNKDKVVQINTPAVDEYGRQVMSNDLTRIKMKVVLSDVPSTSSFRGQQLLAMSEVTKSLPPQLQAVVVPFVMAMTDSPYKREMIQAIKKALGQGDDQEQITPEMMQQQIQQAVQQALMQSGAQIEQAKLELEAEKVRQSGAKLELEAEKVKTDQFDAQAKAHSENQRTEQDWMRLEIEQGRNQREQSTPPAEPQDPLTSPEIIKARIDAEAQVEIARIQAASVPQDSDDGRLEEMLNDISKAIQALQTRQPDTGLADVLKLLSKPADPQPAPVVNVTIEKGGQIKKEISIKGPSGQTYTGTVTQDDDDGDESVKS